MHLVLQHVWKYKLFNSMFHKQLKSVSLLILITKDDPVQNPGEDGGEEVGQNTEGKYSKKSQGRKIY